MKYRPIELTEMKDFLSANDGWQEVNGSTSTREYVFDLQVPGHPGVVVRVFTSIHKDTSVARRKGGDAIRICSVDLSRHRGLVKSVRVFRVEGWRNNLHRAIQKVLTQAAERSNSNLRRTQQVRSEATYVKRVNRTSEQQELVDHLWTKSDGNYVTEASDLDANKETRNRNLCPHCDGIYARKDLIETMRSNDEDNEVQGWKFRCPTCQSTLIVFND